MTPQRDPISRAPAGAPGSGYHVGLPPWAGVGLKPIHCPAILEGEPNLGFFEVHVENYLVAGGPMHAGEIHLAGFSRETDTAGDPLLIDSHGSAVDPAVWRLYAWTLAQIGPQPILIEWAYDIPAFDRLYTEAQRAARLLEGPNLARGPAGGMAGELAA